MFLFKKEPEGHKVILMGNGGVMGMDVHRRRRGELRGGTVEGGGVTGEVPWREAVGGDGRIRSVA